MANWITHTILADRLLARGLPLDEKAFCIGSIAPDCNVENTDWSSFTPTRETTHWMTGNSKSSADFNGFWENHITATPLQTPRSRRICLATSLIWSLMFCIRISPFWKIIMWQPTPIVPMPISCEKQLSSRIIWVFFLKVLSAEKSRSWPMK